MALCPRDPRSLTDDVIFCRQDATMTDRKAVIKNADMSEEMQQDAVDCATQALEKYNIEKVGTAGVIRSLRPYFLLLTSIHWRGDSG